MTHPLKHTAATLALLALPVLAACDSTSAASPVPSRSASTPAASSTPTPSVAPSTAALQQQATAAYKQIFAAYEAQAIKGGLAPGQKPPAGISDNATGQALADETTELNQIQQRGLRRISGVATISALRVSLEARVGSIIALDSCEDGSNITNRKPDGSAVKGRLIYKTSYYALSGGRLKMTYYYGKATTTCPIK